MTTRIATLLATLILSFALSASAEPLRVCATTPDLGDLARTIGGDAVSVTVFAKGTEDAHFVEPRPSFVKALSVADLYLQTGLDLEIGWAPALLRTARNARVQSGAAGFFDASHAVTPLEIPSTAVDRSMGDVHPLGNPHYLLDPGNGLRVATALRDKLAELRPEAAVEIDRRLAALRARIGASLVGKALAAKLDPGKLAILYEAGKLDPFLESQGAAGEIGGWLGALRPLRGREVIADHNLWPYFAQAFGIRVVAFLEPKPGVAPSTRHLQEVITEAKQRKIAVLLASPYYDRRHADLVARETGAAIAPMAHQVGSRPGVDSYVEMIDADVEAVRAAFEAGS